MNHPRHQKGSILFVVVFIATAIAILATISAGRVVTETRSQKGLEAQTKAYNEAYSQLHLALNVVNSSGYNALNQNMVIRDALDEAALRETTEEALRVEEAVGADRLSNSSWILDPAGVEHGYIEGTNVRVYRARDYIQRLQSLRGETVETNLDATGLSDSYFALEAVGRAGDSVRLVSALVRENEPFSSFVFFQNRHPLGVSGSPRGLIHANDEIHFYFPNGDYKDYVSAVNGFSFRIDGYETLSKSETDLYLALRAFYSIQRQIAIERFDLGTMVRSYEETWRECAAAITGS